MKNNKYFKKLTLILLVCFVQFISAQVPSYVPTNGLVGYWPFSGNTNDISGNNFNLGNNASTLTNDRFGNLNSAYLFDGIYSFMDVPSNNALSLTNNMTLSVWFYCNNTSQTQQGILGKGLSYNESGYSLVYNYTDTSNTVGTGFYLHTATTDKFVNIPTASLKPQAWTHMVGTYDGINLKLYINGILVNTLPSSISVSTSNKLNIGTEINNNRYFNGKIDDIGIWNRALSQEEITNIYYSAISPQTAYKWAKPPYPDTTGNVKPIYVYSLSKPAFYTAVSYGIRIYQVPYATNQYWSTTPNFYSLGSSGNVTGLGVPVNSILTDPNYRLKNLVDYYIVGGYDSFNLGSPPTFAMNSPNVLQQLIGDYVREFGANTTYYYANAGFIKAITTSQPPQAPVGLSSQTFCYGATLANLTITGSTIKWYNSSINGSLLPTTTLMNNGATYYASQNVNGIESVDRLAVTTTIQNTSAPTGLSSQSLAKGLTISAIQVVGSNIKWYANQSNANKYINPLPTSTVLVNGNTYYATQTINGCESTTSLGVLINLTIGLTDVDGNIYNTVDICNQTWMKENLNVSKYKNGDVIPGPLTASDWLNTTSGAWTCYYGQDGLYGKLYNWYAVTDPRGLAPEGWHIPSDVDWTTLTDCLGGKDIAGIKMKEVGNSHWINPAIATNESGFTALPSGYIYVNTLNNSYMAASLGYFCFLWSSAIDATVFRLFNEYPGIYSETDISKKNYGYSVRCTKNSNLSNEIFKNKECFISPNPTHSILNLSVNEGIKIDKLTIVDVTGKIVLEQTKNLSTINVEQLAKGVYILTAYAGDKKYQEKFIKE